MATDKPGEDEIETFSGKSLFSTREHQIETLCFAQYNYNGCVETNQSYVPVRYTYNSLQNEKFSVLSVNARVTRSLRQVGWRWIISV